MSSFKILFLPTTATPIAYYRMAAFAKYLDRLRNVEAHVYQYDPRAYDSCFTWEVEAASNDPMRLQIAQLADDADIVVHQAVHNDYSLGLLMCMKEWLDTPFILELDDYLLDVPVYNQASRSHQPESELACLARDQIALADAIICSTAWLADKCEDINPYVMVVPNTIDFEVWDKPARPRQHKSIRIGWAGGAGHDDDLRLLEKPLEHLFEKHRDVEFYCVNGVPDFFKKKRRVRTDYRWQSIDKYPQSMIRHGFDIGVAPLLDNNFNRAKSNLRWLEYSAMGIPTVASAVEPFNESIVHGRTGYLVKTGDEWVQYLDKLVCDEKKRQQIGEAAQRKVRKSYNTATVTMEYLRVMKRMVG